MNVRMLLNGLDEGQKERVGDIVREQPDIAGPDCGSAQAILFGR